MGRNLGLAETSGGWKDQGLNRFVGQALRLPQSELQLALSSDCVYVPPVKVTATIPAEQLRGLDLHQGDTLQVLSVGHTAFLVQISRADPEPAPRQGAASAWVRSARGVVTLAEGESADDARAAYYAEKYGLKPDER